MILLCELLVAFAMATHTSSFFKPDKLYRSGEIANPRSFSKRNSKAVCLITMYYAEEIKAFKKREKSLVMSHEQLQWAWKDSWFHQAMSAQLDFCFERPLKGQKRKEKKKGFFYLIYLTFQITRAIKHPEFCGEACSGRRNALLHSHKNDCHS